MKALVLPDLDKLDGVEGELLKEVAMPNELYTRQQPLQLDTPNSVTIVGVGGIGFWAAVFAAMSGVPALYLFDPDTVEESNRNRLPLCEGAINRPKVEVTADFIKSLRPDATVVAVQEKLEGVLLELQLSISQVVMDFTDSPKTQITLYNRCKELNKRFVRAGYDGTHFTVTSVVSGWISGDVEQATYEVQPSWVVPSVVAAAMAVCKLMKFPNLETSIDLSEIGVEVLNRQRRLTARCNQTAGNTTRRTTRRRNTR